MSKLIFELKFKWSNDEYLYDIRGMEISNELVRSTVWDGSRPQ